MIVATRTRWYGWQLLITDCSAGLMGAVGIGVLADRGSSGLGLALLIGAATVQGLGAPIIHWSHRRVGVGFLSLGLRLGIPAVTGALAAAVDDDGVGAVLVVGGLVNLAAIVVDIAVLARERAPEPVSSVHRGLELYPMLATFSGRGGALGVGGTFW